MEHPKSKLHIFYILSTSILNIYPIKLEHSAIEKHLIARLVDNHEESKMELHDDDKPIGRILSRREMLTVLGGAGAAFIVGTGFRQLALNQTVTPAATSTAIPSCVVKPALTEGPYF